MPNVADQSAHSLLHLLSCYVRHGSNSPMPEFGEMVRAILETGRQRLSAGLGQHDERRSASSQKLTHCGADEVTM